MSATCPLERRAGSTAGKKTAGSLVPSLPLLSRVLRELGGASAGSQGIVERGWAPIYHTRPGAIYPGRLSHLVSSPRKGRIQATAPCASEGRGTAAAPLWSVGGKRTPPGTRCLCGRAAHNRGKHPWRSAAPLCPQAQSGMQS
ncbi:hypothetical protein NDU88_004322 [Pleurodeles waltl]|uniref:Uncharacterized protein n=1 Tax=Pleurodeles waltl TaxID=8319 RepID=A0AAV7T7U7_PLEWA|nr:hypothetical protein NDU88_004322 [Pleurodeles waltl]